MAKQLERRTGVDRRSAGNIILLDQPIQTDIVQMGYWLIEEAKSGSLHSALLLTCGKGLSCKIVSGGHAGRYVDTMRGHLESLLPRIRM